MIETYGYASCTSCRKTDGVLRALSAEVQSRDIIRQPLKRDELAGLFERAGVRPRDVLSRRSKVYGTRREAVDAMSDDDLLSLMAEEPTLIRRPIVIADGGVVIGHDETRLRELVTPVSSR
jgi:Spx/MgsR family transcriptional regulator